MTRQEFMDEYADNLRRIMHEQDLTVSELARRSKLDKGTISRHTRGKAIPNVLHVIRLTKALNCSFKDLINPKEQIVD